MISQMAEIKIGLDLTKIKIKKFEEFNYQTADKIPDMEKIKRASINVGLDLTKDLPSVIEYPRYL
jgi:hypothetical protein